MELHKNNEIIGSYDKTLAAKCENGTFVGKMDGDILKFKGIPFAQPPVGNLRWKLPQPPEASDKVFEAFEYGKQAIQPQSFLDLEAMETGEDCLTLNVSVNTTDKTEKKAVMVWIHGGAHVSGAGSSPLYESDSFLTNVKDIILVTINYRLGLMGFVDFSNIKGGEAYPDTNLGIHDQVAALKWVKKNIAAFGGDPERITIFGESAGGGSVATLTVIPEAKGLFKRAIMQSGSLSLSTPRKTTTLPADYLAREFNAQSMEDLLAIPEKDLKEYWIKNGGKASNFIIMDGRLYSKDPFELYEEGVTKDIDIMQGFMKDEWRLFSVAYQPKGFYDEVNKYITESVCKQGNDEFRKAYEAYLEYINRTAEPEWATSEFVTDLFFTYAADFQAEQHAKNGGRGYVYLMDQPCDTPGLGACHAHDFICLFGDFDEQRLKRTPKSEAFTAKMQEMWANFAKTGDPSTKEYKWPQYNTETRPKMMIDDNFRVVNDPLKERRELFKKMAELNPAMRNVETLTDISRGLHEAQPEICKKYGA